MAIGDPYATLDQLKTYLGVDDTVDDAKLDDALAATSVGIEQVCNRQFNDAGTPVTARSYYPADTCLADVDDFHTAVDLVVRTDDDDDGVFETTWAAGDFQLEPLNGIQDGQPGWPFRRLRAVGTRPFPCRRRASLEVTARWGWATVPAPVKQACLIVAAETVKLKDAPFGVAGFSDFGAVRIRNNPIAMKMLEPYRRNAVLVA